VESVGRAREADASMPAALDLRIGRDPNYCPFLSVQSTVHLARLLHIRTSCLFSRLSCWMGWSEHVADSVFSLCG
jgi:hypothetical protein